MKNSQKCYGVNAKLKLDNDRSFERLVTSGVEKWCNNYYVFHPI